MFYRVFFSIPSQHLTDPNGLVGLREDPLRSLGSHSLPFVHRHMCLFVLEFAAGGTRKLRYITLLTLQYVKLQYITLHYTTLHYITLHYTTLHYAHIYIM